MKILILLLFSIAFPAVALGQHSKPCQDAAAQVPPIVITIISRTRTREINNLREWIDILSEQRSKHAKAQSKYLRSRRIWIVYQQVIHRFDGQIKSMKADLAAYPSEADLVERFARLTGLCGASP